MSKSSENMKTMAVTTSAWFPNNAAKHKELHNTNQWKVTKLLVASDATDQTFKIILTTWWVCSHLESFQWEWSSLTSRISKEIKRLNKIFTHYFQRIRNWFCCFTFWNHLWWLFCVNIEEWPIRATIVRSCFRKDVCTTFSFSWCQPLSSTKRIKFA